MLLLALPGLLHLSRHLLLLPRHRHRPHPLHHLQRHPPLPLYPPVMLLLLVTMIIITITNTIITIIINENEKRRQQLQAKVVWFSVLLSPHSYHSHHFSCIASLIISVSLHLLTLDSLCACLSSFLFLFPHFFFHFLMLLTHTMVRKLCLFSLQKMTFSHFFLFLSTFLLSFSSSFLVCFFFSIFVFHRRWC